MAMDVINYTLIPASGAKGVSLWAAAHPGEAERVAHCLGESFAGVAAVQWTEVDPISGRQERSVEIDQSEPDAEFPW